MCLACPCALRVWRAYVPYVPKCFTRSRALRTCVILFFSFLRVFLFYVSYVHSFFTCLDFFICLHYFACLHFLRTLRTFVFYVPLLFYVPYMPLLFHMSYLSLSFYMSYVPSYFYVLYVVSLCLSVSNFWRTLRAFNLCYRTWNNIEHNIFT